MAEQQWLCRYCGLAIPGEASSQRCVSSPDGNHRRGEPWSPEGEIDPNCVMVAGSLFALLSANDAVTNAEPIEQQMNSIRFGLSFMTGTYRATVTKEE